MLICGSLLVMAVLAGGQSPIGICVGASACVGAQNGDLWSDTTTGTLKRYNGASWSEVGGGGSAVPTGSIVLIEAGACPSGYTEVSALNGRTLVGTLDANANVGTTGGADSITPAGTNGAPTFTGTPFSSVINHTHPVTDPGHTHVITSQTATTGSATSYEHGVIDTSSADTEASEVTASATTGVTTSNPAGGVASITPAGTNSAPVFTGTAFDNRSAFLRVIACKKT